MLSYKAHAAHWEGPWYTDWTHPDYQIDYNPTTGLLDDCRFHEGEAVNLRPSFPAFEIFPAGPTNILAAHCFENAAYYNQYLQTPITSGLYRGMKYECAVNFAGSTEKLSPTVPWPFSGPAPEYPTVFRNNCFVGIDTDGDGSPDICQSYSYGGSSGYDCSLYYPYVQTVEQQWLAHLGVDPSAPGGTPPGGSGTPPTSPGAGGSTCNDSPATVKDPDCLTKHQRDIIMDRITIGDQNNPGTVNIGTVYEGGEQLIIFINELWNDIWIPHLQTMIAQWSVVQEMETAATGMLLDADAVNRVDREFNKQEMDHRLNLKPSAQVCVSNTLTPILGVAEQISRSVAEGYRNDFIARALNASTSPEREGPGADFAIRWENYETIFCEDEANTGAPGCTTDGTLPNGDLAVEQILLSDTINHSTPEVRAAAYALLRHLVDSNVAAPLPANITDTSAGQQILLARRNQTAQRQIPVSIVADIIARRTNIPNTPHPVTGETMNPFSAEVREIRENAGVDAADISDEPSYNEIMLALTKEQFLTPDYYLGTIGLQAEMSQEQAKIDQLINLQLYDLYDLQEKINALIALRTSLKINNSSDPLGSGR